MATLKGESVLQDAVQAFRWIQAAAEQDLAQAQEQAAGMLEYGNGVLRDFTAAAYWYGRAAEQGSRWAADAYRRLTIASKTGPDPVECLAAGREALANRWYPAAEELLLRAVKGGLATAYYPLAEVYGSVVFDHELSGAERDSKAAALKYYVLAAREVRWDAGSYCILGFKIGELARSAQDREAAVECYRQAVRLGSVEAMQTLGEIHVDGKLVTQDFAEAARWFLRAAEAGDTYSLGLVAFMYAHGLGVEQDFATAEHWARRAVDAGNEQGRDVLGQLSNPITRLSLKMQGKLKVAELAFRARGR
jgi:TPR repeat protein